MRKLNESTGIFGGAQHRSKLSLDYQWYFQQPWLGQQPAWVTGTQNIPLSNLGHPPNHISSWSKGLKKHGGKSGSGSGKGLHACLLCPLGRYPQHHYHDVIDEHAHPGWTKCWHSFLDVHPADWIKDRNMPGFVFGIISMTGSIFT